jgi:hypothetical protein
VGRTPLKAQLLASSATTHRITAAILIYCSISPRLRYRRMRGALSLRNDTAGRS